MIDWNPKPLPPEWLVSAWHRLAATWWRQTHDSGAFINLS
jgi:hypothetical protein